VSVARSRVCACPTASCPALPASSRRRAMSQPRRRPRWRTAAPCRGRSSSAPSP
jgi:hypothetical protein